MLTEQRLVQEKFKKQLVVCVHAFLRNEVLQEAARDIDHDVCAYLCVQSEVL